MLKTRALALLTGTLVGALVLCVGVLLGSLVRIPPSYHPPNYQASTQAGTHSDEKKHAGDSHWSFTAEEWIAIGTVILAGATFLLAVATVGLWGVTRRGVKTQIDDTRILQRAYLAVIGGGVDPFDIVPQRRLDDDPDAPRTIAHIIVRNTGNLPARDVSWFIAYCLSPDGSLSHFPIDGAKFFGRNVVPPGTDMWRSQICELDPQDILGFYHAGWHFYIWGEIRYLDGFSERRMTKFCHRYDSGSVGATGHRILRAEGMRFHQFGNDAD
jgi:hypothetical protein